MSNAWDDARRFDDIAEVCADKSDDQVRKLNADLAFKLRDMQRAWQVMADIRRGTADPEEVRQVREWAKQVMKITGGESHDAT